MEIGTPTAGHFIYIPVVLLLGIVIGWVLGSRAAADAMAMEKRRREERASERRQRLATSGRGDPIDADVTMVRRRQRDRQPLSR